VPRHLFRSDLYRQAVYLDFINPRYDDDDESIEAVAEDQRWRKYFRNKDEKHILFGLVLDIVVGRNMDSFTPCNQSIVHAGAEALRRIHAAGVLHGDVGNFENNVILATESGQPKDESFVWIDFSMAKCRSHIRSSAFDKAALREIDTWTRIFSGED
jgi:RIO-like serine/threonine protein kinase